LSDAVIQAAKLDLFNL